MCTYVLFSCTQDGITPYSLAIRSKNPDCAHFVATYIAASPKVRTKPTNEEVRLSIFDFVNSSDPGDMSPYETVDGSFRPPTKGGSKPRSMSLHNTSLEVTKKLFPRKKSVPCGVPYSISNPHFNKEADQSDDEEEESRQQRRRSSSGKQKSTGSSRRGSEHVSCYTNH